MNNEIIVTFKGITKPLRKWAKEYGQKTDLLYRRYVKDNWDFEKALTTPVRQTARYEYRGQMYTAKELADINGYVTESTMDYRLKSGWETEIAVTTPNKKKKRSGMRKRGKTKPDFCTDPECSRCPYPDCVW